MKNLIQAYTKTHRIAQFKKKFSEVHVPEPSSKAYGFAMRRRHANFEI